MATMPKLGPVIMGTLLTRDLAITVQAYVKYLRVNVLRSGYVSLAQATFWGQPHLSDYAYVILANELGHPFMRIIEDPDCETCDRLKMTGWMALEIAVKDVDKLASSLVGSPFDVLRPVANLSLSENIRAVQVRGPCGEILYLTQIKAPVAPFELPMAKCEVDRVFIPVLCTHDRAKSLAFYEKISGNTGLKFDTKITVVNQAYGYDLRTDHPVATLQLKGESLIEIDEIKRAAENTSRLYAGIFMVSFGVDNLPAHLSSPKTCPSGQQKSLVICGTTGEQIELVETLSE